MFINFLDTAKVFTVRFSIIHCLLFSVACNMVKEIDIDYVRPSPKLSVTAILEGGSGDFTIRLIEDRSLPGLPEPYYLNQVSIIRNGEIRLYEDDKQILSIPGPFDMSRYLETGNVHYMYKYGKYGYSYWGDDINTRIGSVYRLEVEVEGYPMAVSTSVMPPPPVVDARMDTSMQVVMINVKEIPSLGQTYFQEPHPVRYWPVSVSVDNSSVNNNYTFEIYKFEKDDYTSKMNYSRIGTSDASILLEAGIDQELISSDRANLYVSTMITTNEFTFLENDIIRKFYAEAANIPKDKELDEDQYMEKFTTYHSLALYVKNITPVIYQYYRGMTLQLLKDDLFNQQPNIVVGNFENAYGSFSTQNTTIIPLLEWETHKYITNLE